MVNYVNTVLVSNHANGTVLAAAPANAASMSAASADAGKFIIMNCDPIDQDMLNEDANLIYNVDSSNAGSISTIKVGIVTKKNCALHNPDGTVTYKPIIKWSNEIKAADIKSYNFLSYAADTEDVVYINFRNLTAAESTILSQGNRRIVVRLTFKDMPHRYRKWTESYEYTTQVNDTANDIVKGIVAMINKEWKRARVVATLGTASAGSNPGDPDTISATAAGSEASANAVILTAMPYDDDDSVDSISPANKVRFNANIYYTKPDGDGWDSLNKYFPTGVQITKEPGKQYPASAKLVRDRESWAMGYLGILNRGEGTWPIIKPAMETDLSKQYDAITLEFENMYRAADDIQRKTKQTLEVYGLTTKLASLKAILDAFVA